MTIKDLRTFIDNLGEFVDMPGGIGLLKSTVLELAISGQLVGQDTADGTTKDMLSKEGLKIQSNFSNNKLPFEIPETWEWVKVKDLAEKIEYGYTASASAHEVGPHMLRITDIQDGEVNWESVPYCEIEEQKVEKYLVTEGDILFARTGGTTGKSYLVGKCPRSIFASYLIRIRANTAVVVPEYLSLYFYSNYYWAQIKEESQGTGQPNCNGKKLGGLNLPLPPKSEQQRIIREVSAYFSEIDRLALEQIALNESRNKLVSVSFSKATAEHNSFILKHLPELIHNSDDAKACEKYILSLAISGQLVPQDPVDGTAEELYKEIQAEKARLVREGKLRRQKDLLPIRDDEIPFEIPKSWKWVRLGEVVSINTGKTPPTTKRENYRNEVPFVGPGNITISSTIELLRGKGVSKDASGAEFAVSGDILLVCIGGTIGKVTLVDQLLAFNQQIDRFRTDLYESKFLLRVVQSSYFYNQLWKQKAGGATPIINQKALGNILIPILPKLEQTRISKRVEEFVQLINRI